MVSVKIDKQEFVFACHKFRLAADVKKVYTSAAISKAPDEHSDVLQALLAVPGQKVLITKFEYDEILKKKAEQAKAEKAKP